MRSVYLPLILLSILFSGCFNIFEDISLNKNGSGTYLIKIDMGELLKNPMLKGLMDGEKDDAFKDVDSTFYFRDFPDSVISDNPDLWKRVYMKIFSNAEKEMFYTSIHLDFKSVDEIAYLSEHFEKVMGKSKGSGAISEDMLSGGASSGFMAKGLQYALNGKSLTRKSDEMTMKDEEKDNMEMMKGFLSEATYQITYTLPGKVKQVTIPNATINGNKVTTKVKMTELMENKVSLDGKITYK